MTEVGVERQNVPSVKLLTVCCVNVESCDLIVEEAELLGYLEVYEPRQPDMMKEEEMRLERRKGNEQSQQMK